MEFKNYAVILLVVGASGCVATPKIIYGNEASVLVGNVERFNIQESFVLADEHCRKHGKVARLTDGGGNFSAAFDCVAKTK